MPMTQVARIEKDRLYKEGMGYEEVFEKVDSTESVRHREDGGRGRQQEERRERQPDQEV
jgi:hypothetical protein